MEIDEVGTWMDAETHILLSRFMNDDKLCAQVVAAAAGIAASATSTAYAPFGLGGKDMREAVEQLTDYNAQILGLTPVLRDTFESYWSDIDWQSFYEALCKWREVRQR